MRAVVLLACVLLAAGCGAADDGTGDEADGGPQTAPSQVLTVEEAVDYGSDTPTTVRGALVADGGRVRLCGALAESYPPQCGRPWLRVHRLELETVDDLEHASGVSWKESVLLFGIVTDGGIYVGEAGVVG